MTKHIELTVDSDGIATLLMATADSEVNVLSEAFSIEITACFDRVINDDAIRGAVLASNKSTFIAGGDLDLLQSLDFDAGLPYAYEALGVVTRKLRELETCGKPVIAAIAGSALGGGFEIALACHMRICQNNSALRIGLPEVTLGLLPGGGGTQRLPRLVGLKAGLDYMLSGKLVGVDRALKDGLINEVTDSDVLTLAKSRIRDGQCPIQQPWDERPTSVQSPWAPQGTQHFLIGNALTRAKTKGNTLAEDAILSCVYEGMLVPLEQGTEIELRYFVKILRSRTTLNQIRSVFDLPHRVKRFTAEKSRQAKQEIKKIGVLGAGLMGAGIASVCARSGLSVVMLDKDGDAVQRGLDRIESRLRRDEEKGRLNEGKATLILANIQATSDFTVLQECDFIIEAVFENKDVKARVTQSVEQANQGRAILGSNTSTIPITQLAEAAQYKDKFIGVHFFSPVERMDLVEVIMGKHTSEDTLNATLKFIKAINKLPIVVNDSRGFYTSRTYSTFPSEGLFMLREGVHPNLIENAAIQAGMPVGPLTIADEVGIDIGAHVIKQFQKEDGDAFNFTQAHEVSLAMYDEGRFGRKVGKGFFDYREDGSKELWPELAKRYPVADTQPDFEELKERFLTIQAIEAIRCLEENVVTTADAADVGALLGWSYPKYTGGPMSYVDTVGVEEFLIRCENFERLYGDRYAPPGLLVSKAKASSTFCQWLKPQ